MTSTGVSRREAFEAGACALAGAVGLLVAAKARAGTKQSTTSEEIVRKWYKTWEKADVDQFVALMAANFTFTSPNNDDHISASEFKTRCWDSQTGFIERFDLEHVLGNDDEVFVRYLCHTKNGKSFRNVEYFRLRAGKLEALECYFGGHMTVASAVSKT